MRGIVAKEATPREKWPAFSLHTPTINWPSGRVWYCALTQNHVRIRIMINETSSLILLCSQCNTELQGPDMLEFGGGVACERCIRTYYNKQNSIDPDIHWDVELEVQTRRRNAADWLTRNRKALEKHSVKK
jgi:hypothetical protein